jgi:hypothetical protein
MLGQGISGNYWPEFFKFFDQFDPRFKGSPVFCHEEGNNIKIILTSMTII